MQDKAECYGISVFKSLIYKEKLDWEGSASKVWEIQVHMEPQKSRRRYRWIHFQRFKDLENLPYKDNFFSEEITLGP